jgi:hypothetical protein
MRKILRPIAEESFREGDYLVEGGSYSPRRRGSLKTQFRTIYLKISRESRGVRHFDLTTPSSFIPDPSVVINSFLSKFEEKLNNQNLMYSEDTANKLSDGCLSVISRLVPINY